MKKLEFLIFFLALTFRVTFSLLTQYEMPDSQSYLIAGESLFKTGFLGSDITMPLFPIWSYGWLWLGGGSKFLLHSAEILISIAAISVYGKISWHLFGLERARLLTMLMMAVYPFTNFYASVVLTENLFVFLFGLALLFYFEKKWIWGAFVLAFTILLRPIPELIGPLIVLLFGLLVHKISLPRTFEYVVIYLGFYLLVMTPWWIHNYLKYNEFVRLNLGDGIVWISGNNPENKFGGGISKNSIKHFPDPTRYDIDFEPYELKYPNIIDRSKAMKKDAFDYIKNNPERFIKMMGVKFLRFWRLYPHHQEFSSPLYKWVMLLSFLPILFLTLLSFSLFRREHWMRASPILLFGVFVTFVHSVTFASIRYRFPLEPFMIVFAGFALAYL